MPLLVHMTISIPHKYPTSQAIGLMEGKNAIHVARVYGERKQNFAGGRVADSCPQ